MSSSGGGTAEGGIEAGCSLSEGGRSVPHPPPSLRQRQKTKEVPVEVDGLAVFTWGRGEDGQLGLGDTSDQDEPTYVDALRGVGVRQIACGSGHTVVLTTDGEVYTWGAWISVFHIVRRRCFLTAINLYRLIFHFRPRRRWKTGTWR